MKLKTRRSTYASLKDIEFLRFLTLKKSGFISNKKNHFVTRKSELMTRNNDIPPYMACKPGDNFEIFF
jgi:hypothetical protein